MIRNLYLDSTDNSKLDFYLDGKRVTQMYLDGVLVWDIGNNFEIKVARNSNGTMEVNFQLPHFVGCTEVIFDFGDGSHTTLNSDNPYVTHIYNEDINNATILINAENCTELGQNFLANANEDYAVVVLEVSLANTIAKLGRFAFFEFFLEKITLTNNVKIIRDWCFAYTKLIKIDLKQVVNIGAGAFYRCNALTEITTPKSATFVGESAFYQCTNLKKAVLNQSCNIASYQFYDCKLLSEVIISNNVTGIGNHVFYGCEGLTSINIPNSVTFIGQYIFDGKYIRTINCDFTHQELTQRAISVENIIEDYQSEVVYTFHCTDKDIFLNGSDFQ